MADDRIDWAAVAAFGTLLAEYHRNQSRDVAISHALREAYQAGQREGESVMKKRIDRAFDMAGNRWLEWGDRAVAVAEILDGDYDSV
jgi:hypothetical protein